MTKKKKIIILPCSEYNKNFSNVLSAGFQKYLTNYPTYVTIRLYSSLSQIKFNGSIKKIICESKIYIWKLKKLKHSLELVETVPIFHTDSYFDRRCRKYYFRLKRFEIDRYESPARNLFPL